MATPPSNHHRPLCQFHVRTGSCRAGSSCRFSHSLPPNLTRSAALKTIPCPYFQRGNCRFGNSCELLHDEEAPPSTTTASESPNLAVNNDTEEPPQSNSLNEPCGICLEPITSQSYGLLSHCPHVFCFACIMEWRSSSSSATTPHYEQQPATNRRVCPVCRTSSDYVMPSPTLPSCPDEKEYMLHQYKARLAKRPCKKWNGEMGSCPFGSDCFYSHLDENGVDVKSGDGSMQELYEERRRLREERDESQMMFDLEMIQELIMMGMSGGQFVGSGGGGGRRMRRRRGQRDRRGASSSREEDEDDEFGFPFDLPFGADDFFNELLNHFVSEHMRHGGVRGYDSESEDDSDSDDSSMPELENVPRRGDGVGFDGPPNHRAQHQQSRDQQSDEEDEWESIDESGESDSDGSMPSLEDANAMPVTESDDDSMPELEDMPARRPAQSTSQGYEEIPLWFNERVCVRLLKQDNVEAVIRGVNGNVALVEVLENETTAIVRLEDVSMVEPQLHDMVLVIGGDAAGVEAELISIDDGIDAILKDLNENYRVVLFDQLAKISLDHLTGMGDNLLSSLRRFDDRRLQPDDVF